MMDLASQYTHNSSSSNSYIRVNTCFTVCNDNNSLVQYPGFFIDGAAATKR